MDTRNILLYLLFAAGAMSFNDVEAATLSCQGCSDDEMLAIAEEHLAPHGPGSSIEQLHTYVVNVMDGRVRKFTKIQNVYEDPEIPVEIEIRELDVEPEIISLVRNLKIDLDATGYEIAIPGPSEGSGAQLSRGQTFPNNAYENIVNPSKELIVKDYIDNTYTSLFQKFTIFVNSFNPFTGFNPNAVVITIEVKFNDGSTALYNYNNEMKEWIRIPKSSRDSNNNIIPEEKSDVDGKGVRKYEFIVDDGFLNQDYRNFVDHVSAMGWNFTGGGSYFSSYSIVCAGDTCAVTLIR